MLLLIYPICTVILCQTFTIAIVIFLIKRKPWHGNGNQAWGGTILDPNSDDDDVS